MKQIIFILMMLVLPMGTMAQVDDLYYVPTKKKAIKEVKATTSNNPVKAAPTTNTIQSGTSVVRIGKKSKSNIVNGIDEDEYNRRTTQSAYPEEQEYAEEEVYEGSSEEEYIDEAATDVDYTYSSRIVRFHSPRRAVILSSPLYWDVVYNCGLDNWTIYDDGIYWDVYPDYSYTTIYASPWYSPSWSWHFGCGWGYSYGWTHSPWYWNLSYHHHHWHHPHYPIGGWHHHGHHFAGGGWHHSFNGGYRNAIYTNRDGGGRGNYVPRATGPSRADAGVRAGTVASNDRKVSTQSDRTVRRTSNAQRVYNRPSSTRNNVTRNNATNERTRSNNSVTRSSNNTTRTNNAVREDNSSKVKRNSRNVQKKESVNRNNSNKNNNRSSYNNSSSSERRSSISRSNSRSNNSRSSIGSQSRGSSFSGGGSRSSGGSRGGGGGRR